MLLRQPNEISNESIALLCSKQDLLDQWKVCGFDGNFKSQTLPYTVARMKNGHLIMVDWIMVMVIFALR